MRLDVEKKMSERKERRKRKIRKVGEEHEGNKGNKSLVIKAKQKLASQAALTVCHPGSLRLSITLQSF